MLNKKLLTIGIGVSALAVMLLSFTSGDDGNKKKKYHVIHQKDGELVEYDTILPMNSDYSVANFLADKGIESDNVEIIKIPASSDNHFIFHGDNGEDHHQVIVKEFHHDMEIDGEEGEHKEVKIISEMGEDGKMVTKKYVDGKEVEVTESDEMHFQHHGNGEDVIIKMEIDEEGGHDMDFITEEDGKEVKIFCEMGDDGEMKVQKFVDGEEVELTKEEQEQLMHHKGMHGGHMMMRMDHSEMSDEEMQKMMEEMKVHMAEHGMEMDSLMKHIEIKIETMENEMSDGEEGHRVCIKHIEMDSVMCGEMHEHMKQMHEDFDWNEMHSMMKVHHSDEDFTIVLVTENIDENAAANENVRIEKQTESMLIYPNPNDGTFTIQFEQSEKAKTMVQVIDASGKVVFKDKLGNFSGTYKKELNMKEHGSGTYIVKIQRGDDVTSGKVIVE